MKIDNQLFLNYIEYKQSLNHDELVQKDINFLYYITALPAIIVLSIYLQFVIYFILSNVLISIFVSQEYFSNIQKLSFNFENISYAISLLTISGIFYTFSQKYFMPKLNSWIKRKFGISEIDIFANFIYKDRIEKLFVDSAERNIVFKRNFYEIKENILTHSGLSLELINKCIIKIQYAKENAIELSVNNTDRIFNDFVFTDIEIALMEANTKVGSLLNELKTIINTK